MGEDKTRCEQCGWVGADSLLIEVRHYDDADIMCPACQQVIMGEEPRLADWKALCLAAEAERDALAAELATVKAALPRWRKDDDGVAYRLTVGPIERWVEPCGDGMWRAPYIGTTRYSRADAMLAVTEALGLPPCEVEGE